MIYTSYFDNLKNLIKLENTKIISIAGKSSDEFIELMNKYPDKYIEYKKLAPKYIWWKEWHDKKLSNEWYIEKYNNTVLLKLNPDNIYLELTNNNTMNAVILCWENKGKFCHRHLVAKWLNRHLKVKINEI